MTNHEPLRCQVDGCPNEVTCIVHDDQTPFATCGQHNDHDCNCGQCLDARDTVALARALMQALSKNEAESAKFGAEIETKKRELFEAKLRIKMLEESLILAQGAS